jgi:predicted  nucleic acid-binding Zn-ribbon protein
VAFDLSELTAERDNLQNELLVVSELMHQCIHENAHVALDQADYQKRYDGLTERFDKAKARLEAVTGEISDKQVRQATIEAFLDELKRLDGVTEFQPVLWYSLANFYDGLQQGRYPGHVQGRD